MANRWAEQPLINLEGQLLVASPNWQHETFGRTVCLVVHHRPVGAIGIVLNRDLRLPDEQLWQQLAGEKVITRRAALTAGGPQSGPVVALHSRQDLAEYTSAEGVYFAAQIQNLQELVTTAADDSQVKIIIGQSDWAPGELDSEFRQGKWLPLPVTPQVVFADSRVMWSQALRKVGDHYVAAITRSRVRPSNVLTN